MKIEHLDEGVGRIIKGVNTTPDVGVNQTSIEAAKFGNKVDKDGRPPTLSTKVKGKSTNVHFNLGMVKEDTEPRYTAREWAIIEGGHSLEDTVPQTKKPGRIFEALSEYELEDRHPNERPEGPEFKPTMPQGTIRVKVTDVYDWYKLGQHISDLANIDPEELGKGPPQAVISFGSEEEEHKYVDLLQKLGLEIIDIDPGPPDAKGVKGSKTYSNESIKEDVEIDNRDGWGAVPWNQEVDYRGLRVKMKPSVFINLAASRNGEPPVPKVVQYVKDGGAIGAPFLQIFVDEDDSQIPEVRGHEGRSRMAAILEVYGDIPVEVHLFFQGKVNRNRHITPEFVEKIQRYLISENDKMVRGPLFEI